MTTRHKYLQFETKNNILMKMHLQMSSKTQRPFFRPKCDKIVTQTVHRGRRNWLIHGTKKKLSDAFLEHHRKHQ